MKYSVMQLPCSIQPDHKLWCIVGESKSWGSGVLAWCYDEEHAVYWYEQMKDDPEFTKISYEKFIL
jgi:hypothetical protein